MNLKLKLKKKVKVKSLVKGYPDEFNSWVSLKDLKNL